MGVTKGLFHMDISRKLSVRVWGSDSMAYFSTFITLTCSYSWLTVFLLFQVQLDCASLPVNRAFVPWISVMSFKICSHPVGLVGHVRVCSGWNETRKMKLIKRSHLLKALLTVKSRHFNSTNAISLNRFLLAFKTINRPNLLVFLLSPKKDFS